MALTQCRRCGGQISTNDTSCPWCGHATTFNLVGPILLLLLIGVGISFALGFLRWEWLEQTLGLDRGFVDVASNTASAPAASGGGGDLLWRMPPGPDPAANLRTNHRATKAAASRPQTPVAPQRIAAVVRTGHAAPAGALGCADSAAVSRLIARYPTWSNADLGLISCGSVRAGFSTDQVHASLGTPFQVERAGPGREEWRYKSVTLIVEQGRVISYGQ